MPDPSSDEMLSAYLDGELTAEEQSQIERRLADSPELRQLLDDLRALRGGLESLPQYRLDQDFAARVLRRAEQAMLVESAASDDGRSVAAAAAERDAPQPAIVGDTLRRWKNGGLRTWGWAVAAIAAGLVIMVFDRQQPVVQNPPPAHGVPAPMDGNWIAVDEPRGEPTGEVATKAEAPAGEGGVMGKADVGATAATGGAAKGGEGEVGALAGPSTTLSGAAAVPPNAIAIDETKKEKARAQDSTVADELSNDMLVVNCTVTREALEQRQFDRLLNERQIVLDDSESEKSSKDVSQFAASTPPSSTGRPAPARKANEASKQSSVASEDGKNKAAAAEGDVDAVLVDSTAGQISAVLDDLNKNPKWFPSIQVDPAPQAPVQQSLTVYNRGDGRLPQSSDLGVASDRDKIVGGQKEADKVQMNVQTPEMRPMAKPAAPQTPSVDNLGANRANMQQSRAKRFAVPSQAQEAQNLTRSRSLSLNQNAANAPNLQQQQVAEPAPAGAASNLGQSFAGKLANEPAQMQLNVRGDLSDRRRGGNEESAPVRALFLLRVVDQPAVPAAPAESEQPMTK